MKLTDRAEQLLNSADTPTGLIVGIKIPVSDTVRISADLSSKMSGGGQKAKKGGAEVGTRRSRSLRVQALSFVHGMTETAFRGDIYQVWRNDTGPTLHGEFLSLRCIDKSVLFGNLSVQGHAGFYIACVSRPKDGVFDTA